VTAPVGILGGTFDPVHCGHLAVAEYVWAHCALAQIQFLPCLLPPHRQPPRASPAQRLAMIRLAIAGHPDWIVNDIDFQRPGPSYMIDTLTILRQQQPQTPWCLLLGMDAFAHFNQWRQWQKILQLAHLIVVNRPGCHLSSSGWEPALLRDTQARSADDLTQSLAGKILIQEMPPCDISATAIRQKFPTSAATIALPPEVLQYIKQHHLYL